MTVKRRTFLKKTIAATGLAGIGINELLAKKHFSPSEMFNGTTINLAKPKTRNYWKPLEKVYVTLKNKHAQSIKIWDGESRLYTTIPYQESFEFEVGGALGYQKISLHNITDELLDWAVFPVNCETEIVDEKNEYKAFFNILYHTLHSSSYAHGKTVRYNGEYYRYYSSWFQDHVFVAEGMKYFTSDVKTGIDLYADGQREDGLIWDNYKHPYPDLESYWEYRFNYGGFTKKPEDPQSSAIFVRIPVENIGEHTFLEGLYYAWKATGDDQWMKSRLDNALKAVEFATSSPYYWSEEKKLLKRPFSIDRWDFQSDFDAEITGKDFMGVDLEKTHYGIMFGDNICFANGCNWLAEMLEYVGRKEEAGKINNLGKSIWKRINDLSWNGKFYEHWVTLESDRNIDFGVDTSKQVTLSNAMALIRGLEHEKCKAIIETYMEIKEEMPASSPGEWYMCYPPFEKGWHINKWEYMNGGVSPILAGDLALGAMEHGHEKYGIDILKRLHQLARKSDGLLRGCYKGKIPEPPSRTFQIIDLTTIANASYIADKRLAIPTFGSHDADLRNLPTGKQTFEGIPFYVMPPADNNGKSCLIIKPGENSKSSVEVPVHQHATSLYLLHTTDTNGIAGIFRIHYEDNTRYSKYIVGSSEISHYWYPTLPESKKGIPKTVIAWKGPAEVVGEVGIYAHGMDNPHPGKKISHFEFFNEQNINWAILGITLSDGRHYFEPSIVSTIPDHWASAHVLKALIEGLAGIKSKNPAFKSAMLSPRWKLADVNKVRACAKFEPSGGYLSYEYTKLSDNHYEIRFTGNGNETEIKIPVPEKKSVNVFLVNDKVYEYSIILIESTSYLVSVIQGAGVYNLKIGLV